LPRQEGSRNKTLLVSAQLFSRENLKSQVQTPYHITQTAAYITGIKGAKKEQMATTELERIILKTLNAW